MILSSYTYSIIGGRSENQDSVGRLEDVDRGLYVVADGLGGHQAGRVAADCAVASLLGGWSLAEPLSEGALSKAVERANDAILETQHETGLQTKTTVVVLALQGEQAIWANTGDSRLYYIHEGKLAARTEDHSLAYQKYRIGMIQWEDIPLDPDQNLLLRSLGNVTGWEPQFYTGRKLSPGDGFLLCSDGLWELLSAGEIAALCYAAKDAKAWADKLIRRVEARIGPGHDNVSFITVKLA